ncbi:PDDEXK-like family protein [Algoriphagus antarcticus]|uniref:PD-(D/E)XK nuclease superfamily protein n=1 Tax=Algoriphagus antarcticus TaxID=238540 RepID=A0A3E0DP58_9BACT|nr:PD-(D/E)XK nuclease family protein [Algoriphagus antarcticus]REG83624.1 PD-(D/E)XK nuclease superfamily protein [Algoriphagus antarcticus]
MTDNFTIDQIRDEIIKFKNDPDFQKLENFYYSKSFSEILGVSRREISHSGFLAWLLGNLESHNLGEFPIKKFLDIILKFSNDKLKTKHSDLFNSFVTEDYLIERLFIKSEYAIKNVGRLDIYIELTLLIAGKTKNIKLVIENKVESRENNDQTNSYFNFFNPTENDDNIVIYVYLTPISTLELIELTEPECNCKAFIQINYQSIVDYLIEPALNQNISTRTQNILTEYLKSLSQPSIDEEADGHKQELIMALGNEERKLLSSFWEKNQKLILASLYAISSDPEQEKDTRDSIREALDSLSSDKDRSTYNIKYDGSAFKRNFKKSDIGLQTINLLNAKGLIDQNIINYLKEDKSCSFLLLKKKEDFTETEIKYRKYKTNDAPELIFNGEEFYVARNWGIGNIHKLINKFTDKFPGLEYETN